MLDNVVTSMEEEAEVINETPLQHSQTGDVATDSLKQCLDIIHFMAGK